MFDFNVPLTTMLSNQAKDNTKNTNQMSCHLCVEHMSDIMALRSKVRSLEREIENSKSSGSQETHPSVDASFTEKLRNISLNETKLTQEKITLQQNLDKARQEISSYASKNEELSRLYETLIDDNSSLTKKLIALEERNCERQEKMSNDYDSLNDKYLALKRQYNELWQKSHDEEKLLKNKISDLESLLEKISQCSIQTEETNRKKTNAIQNENKRLKSNLSSLQLKYEQVNKLAQTLTQSYGEVKKENALLKNKPEDEVPNPSRRNHSFLKQMENITSSLKNINTVTNDCEPMELKKVNADLQKKLDGMVEREKKVISENLVIKSELADTKEALLSEIAIMTDKVNDQDDAVKHYRSQVKELVEENRRLENGHNVVKDGLGKINNKKSPEVRE